MSEHPYANDVEWLRDRLPVQIAKRRELTGLSLRQAASQIGIGTTTLYHIENRVGLPSGESLVKILRWLLCGADVTLNEAAYAEVQAEWRRADANQPPGETGPLDRAPEEETA